MKNIGKHAGTVNNQVVPKNNDLKRRSKFNLALLIGILLILGSLIVVMVVDLPQDDVTTSSTTQTEIATDENLVIPVAQITENASFYPVTIAGTDMEVIAVKALDGTIRTAFNTCQVCYDSTRGYYKQDGDVLVCQNCGNRFSMSQVEIESGGCNPWPIFEGDKIETGDTITISYDFLKDSKQLFANWKN